MVCLKMKVINMKKLLVLAAALVSSAAFAVPVPVDVTDTVATIGAQLVPIGLVGAAVLGITVAIKAYKWVRRAM